LGNEGRVGLITYMRTDSTRLAGEALAEVRAFIGENFEPAMLPEEPNFYRSRKGAQDAHEAIRPTLAYRRPELVAPNLNKEQLALYTLIWQRFVACQMAPAVLDQTVIDVAARDHEFRATGSIIKFPGFTKLYEETVEDKNGEDNGSAGGLPDVAKDEAVSLDKFSPEQHFTKPPLRYTEAGLVRALEENGIGRPSTYAQTLNTIQQRGYVEREKNRLKPTELGEEVNALLLKHFADILDVNFTARLEADLDHVEEGARAWRDLLEEFYASFSADLGAAQAKMVEEFLKGDTSCPECGAPMEVREGLFGLFVACRRYPECRTTRRIQKGNVEETSEVCDKCGAKMVIRTGRYGRFMACSGYPKCKNTYNLDENGNKVVAPAKEPPKRTDQKCPECGGALLIRKSRAGDEFYGCENYPKCKLTKPKELGLKCPRPDCDGDLVTKRAKRRRFIGCNKYPECDFSVFGALDRETPCPKCGNSWTIVGKARNKPPTRRCPVPLCDYEEELPEEQAEE